MSEPRDFTFIFMLFNITSPKDDPEFFNGELETLLLNNKFYDNINILIIYTNFFNIPDTTTVTFGTRLVELDKDGENDSWKKKVVANFSNINMGSEDVLGLIFTYVKSAYKSRDYIVYANNHSNQFGGLSENIARTGTADFREDNFINIKKRLGTMLPVIDPAQPPFAQFEYSIEPNPKIDMLTYTEFSKALVNGFINNLNTLNGKAGLQEKVAALILISCYSSTMDNIVNFNESVRYLCVSEGEVFYNFINLAKLIEYFVDEKNKTLEDKITILFRNINDDYPDKPHMEEQNIKLTEFSCFNLDKDNVIEEFVKNLNLFVLYCLHNFNVLSAIQDHGYENNNDVAFITKPNETNTYPAKNSIDLFSLFDNIAMPNDEGLKKRIGDLKNSLDKIKFMKYDNHSSRSGVSCFIQNKKLNTLDKKQFTYMAATYSIYSDQENVFSTKTLWPELLEAIEKKDIYQSLQ